MCYLRYGSFTHPQGSVGLTATWQTIPNEAQLTYARKVTINLLGMLTSQQVTEAAAIADIKTKMDAVWAAYSYNDRDLVLYSPSGTATHHNYPTATALGGLRVVQPPSFTDPKGAELVTKASWTATLEATYEATGGPVTKSFEETVQFEGGDWKVGHLETKIGLPVKQLLRMHTIYRAVQRGSAVGYRTYPLRPNPIWPGAVVQPNPAMTYGHPKRINGQYREYPISWSWTFESDSPLVGIPHIWGSTWGP